MNWMFFNPILEAPFSERGSYHGGILVTIRFLRE